MRNDVPFAPRSSSAPEGWLYTQFSNDTLEAMMRRHEAPRQRLFSYYVRNSWGRQKGYAVREDGKAARQADAAEYLRMSKSHLSEEHSDLLRDGWLIPHPTLIIPNPNPPARPAIEPAAKPQELYPGLPSLDEFKAFKDPTLAEDWQKALDQWGAVRKRAYVVEKEYEELVAEFASRTTDGTTNPPAPGEFVVQPENPVVQPAQVVVQNGASLLVSKEHKKNLKSVGRSVVDPAPVHDRPTDPIPFPTELKPEDALVESIERLVHDDLGHLHDVPERSLSLQIIDGLKGAPLDHLRAYIGVRKAKTLKLGILRDYAQAVGKAWLREAGARQRAAEVREAQVQEQADFAEANARNRAEQERIAADETADPHDRARARAVLSPPQPRQQPAENEEWARHVYADYKKHDYAHFTVAQVDRAKSILKPKAKGATT